MKMGAGKRIWVLVSSVDSSSNHALLPHRLRERGRSWQCLPCGLRTQGWASSVIKQASAPKVDTLASVAKPLCRRT